MMYCYRIIIVFLILGNSCCAFGQINFGVPIKELCANTSPYKKLDGEKYVDNRYFKRFAILFRDTCEPMNRFSDWFIHQRPTKFEDFYYPPLLIDTFWVEKAEAFLLNWVDTISDGKKGKLFNSRKGVFYRYIRDYGGFIDQAGDHYIAIQFLTKKQFARYGKYNHRFDLFAMRSKRDKLRFIILKIHDGMVSVHSLFI